MYGSPIRLIVMSVLARSPVKLRTCRGIRQLALKGLSRVTISPFALLCTLSAHVLGMVVVVVVVVVVAGALKS